MQPYNPLIMTRKHIFLYHYYHIFGPGLYFILINLVYLLIIQSFSHLFNEVATIQKIFHYILSLIILVKDYTVNPN